MKFDLHIHSKYSYDCFMNSKTIISSAKRRGLSGIAVTDHNTVKGGLAVKEINSDADFTVIVGSETRTEFGDIIGLYLKYEITGYMFAEVYKAIKAQDGLVVLAHPYRKGKVLPEDLLKYVDYIEGFNARSPRSLNQKAQELAEKHHIPMIAGSDAHTPSEIGMGRTLLYGGADVLLDAQQETFIEGSESNYLITHGLSYLTENIRGVTSTIKKYMFMNTS